MKREMIRRGLGGFPLGITIGHMITILVSLSIGDGFFYAVNPKLIAMAGNELNAVILQVLLCGLVGAGFAMTSVIWDIDSWSLAKQSGVYSIIASLIMFPIAYVANWMQHTVSGILIYIGIFVIIFVLAWFLQYMMWKRKIDKLNKRIGKRGRE